VVRDFTVKGRLYSREGVSPGIGGRGAAAEGVFMYRFREEYIQVQDLKGKLTEVQEVKRRQRKDIARYR
jgi:hypothetical protein